MIKFKLNLFTNDSLIASIIKEFSFVKCLILLKPSFCSLFLYFLFKINFFICLYSSLLFNFFKIIQLSVVSGSPPLFDIIVAHPLDEDSRAVRPNGSSHLDGTTAISDLFKNFNTSLCVK